MRAGNGSATKCSNVEPDGLRYAERDAQGLSICSQWTSTRAEEGMQIVDCANGSIFLLYRKDLETLGLSLVSHFAGRQVQSNMLNRRPYLPATNSG